MKNTKKKLGYIICIIILIFMFIPAGQAAISAVRTIEKNVLAHGNGTFVTVYIKNDNATPLDLLKESIPSGWVITRISDDAIAFKDGEWVWSPTVGNNSDKTVKYGINVPSGTTPGSYNIDGYVSAGVNSTIVVTGDKMIEVTGDNSGSSGSSGSSGNPTNPKITLTPNGNNINVTDMPTVTVTLSEQTIGAPVETTTELPMTTTSKSPGFNILISIGIIATIYILRKMK